MTIFLRKSSIISVVLLLPLLVVFGTRFGHKTTSAYSDPNQPLTVTSDDLARAGYTGISQQQPQDGNYQLPNLYFWVQEGSQGSAKQFTANLLMVSQYTDGSTYNDPLFIYGTTTPVVINGGRGQEAQLRNDTRVALNFAKGAYYIVIIGPDAQKVEALAALVAAKI